ncbi:ribosomal protein S16 [Kockiozyma suomiensis]|uniref:ribosomal protein S16 n=1 Tax=Kockiozyma suomiensis TaxID=1337062 RepID=UPI003343B308
MGVRIRLARMGKVRQPIYNITVSDNKRGLRKEPIEVIGTYNAATQLLPGTSQKFKEIHIDFERARYWLGVGALPSDTVASIFRKFELLPPTEKKLYYMKLAEEQAAKQAEQATVPKEPTETANEQTN